MVDTMLGCDAMFLAAGAPIRIGIVTDDEDLLPAALSAHAANPKLTVWIRRRAANTGLNDQLVSNQGLQIYCF